jgi:serine/threonine protein kinase
MPRHTSRSKVGARLGSDLTVLGIVDDYSSGLIYLVWHHKFWCPMACKVFKSEEETQREADILLALAHPNIVRCLGLNGSTCLLMEFLEGPTLYQMMKSRPRQRLGINDALRISIHIGAALSHVHDRGLLHLDVKPSNIVVAKRRPVLCDFGIARWQNAPRPNHVGSTPAYAAPEECLLKEITPAADIFSLGVTLFQLLTGNRPFPEQTDDVPYPQILQPPSSVRQHRPAVPVGLDELVLSCLSRDPKARPDLAVLLPSLHRYIGSGPQMWPKGFHPEKSTGRSGKRKTLLNKIRK